MELLKQSFMIVGSFLLGWVPYFFELITGDPVSREFDFVADFFSQVSEAINPLVILTFDKTIRKNTLIRTLMSTNKMQRVLTTLAAIAASQSTLRLGRHAAALITRKNGIIQAIGLSHHISPSQTIHAEAHCLDNYAKRANRRKRGKVSTQKLDLIVLRISADSCVFRNSEPCADCALCIKNAAFIRRVYFTANYIPHFMDSALPINCNKRVKRRQLFEQQYAAESRVEQEKLFVNS
ncbi:hypothetical protein HK100_000536 [Physocladia obscura]|uniref:CMP/dCMP-type deaminase domain-containing protein n=1 Tax=Physocladia obscura TaxID=109957 RepID=A0AAD5XCG8_9FUNG|nr:hypothetical protein HK100_000536 [Physocladia obscura]